MCMEMRHPTDGTAYNVEKEAFDQWLLFNNDCQKDDVYKKWVDRLEDVSANIRNFFKEILIPFVTKIGEVVIKIGKIILNILMKIASQFPNTISGILVGFALGLIFTSIPVIGWLLGSLLTPLFALAGGVMGFMADMSKKIADSGLETKIRSKIIEDFAGAGFSPS